MSGRLKLPILPPDRSYADNDTSLARGLIKRLEEEGSVPAPRLARLAVTDRASDYIHALTTVTDEFGLTTETRETRAKSGKGKDKKNKSRKTAQKTRFAFNKQIKSHQKYKDHFTPDPEAESRMLGLDNLVCRHLHLCCAFPDDTPNCRASSRLTMTRDSSLGPKEQAVPNF